MKVQADRFKPNSSSYGLEEVPGMQSPSWLTAALEHSIFKNTEDMKRCSFVLLPHRVVDSWLGEGFFPNHFILCCQKFNILGSFLTLHDSLLFIPMLILQRLSSCFGRFLYRRKKKKKNLKPDFVFESLASNMNFTLAWSLETYTQIFSAWKCCINTY